ncbi:LPXTG cell wall anchor domain-containing protein [Mogibacterium diversum]
MTVAFKDKRDGASTRFTIRSKNQPVVNGSTSSSNGNRNARMKYRGYRVSRGVKTGDTTALAFYLAMFAIASGSLAVFVKKKKT